MPLDLFEHSRDVMLRNAAIDAARAYSSSALASAIKMLASDCAGDPLLPAFDKLYERLSLRSRHDWLARRRWNKFIWMQILR